jgi:hypothetical protein
MHVTSCHSGRSDRRCNCVGDLPPDVGRSTLCAAALFHRAFRSSDHPL